MSTLAATRETKDRLSEGTFLGPVLFLWSADKHLRIRSGFICRFHVKWVHCHHGMACPRVADRGDDLQIWRVAANMLNKQSRTADSGWSSSLGVGSGANNPPP
jgi:hypothetical protein